MPLQSAQHQFPASFLGFNPLRCSIAPRFPYYLTMRFQSLLLALSPTFLSYALAETRNFNFNVVNADLAPDGFTRSTVVVNGQFPGPLISVNKGDTVNVVVQNNLTDSTMRRSTSIHWHGLFQARNAYNDGPSFVTQCPISPEHSYTYSLALGNQTGTYWYHSHLASQYLDGLRGPIVIKDPEDPNLSLYDVDTDETVITLADWFHRPAPELEAEYKLITNTASAEELPQSGLINGVGRTSTDTQPARPVFTVTPGKRYRYRIINTSAITRFDFQIQGHNMTIIEVDGVNHVPLLTQRLTIHAGQRYSVVVEANQTVDNYWIRAPMTARVVGTAPTNWATDSANVNAVLHYEGAPDAEPTTDIPALTGTNLVESDLVPAENPAAPGLPVAGGVDKVFNLVFTTAENNVTGHGWRINGVQYIPPTTPTLLSILSGARNSSDFGTNENTLIIDKGDTVEINLTGPANHPWHLHGHTFSVVKGVNTVPNYVNPPRRDVAATSGTGLTIRFTADNPGPWILHCHIDMHLEAGLAVVFAEAPSEIASGADSVDPDDEWDGLCPIYNALPADMQ